MQDELEYNGVIVSYVLTHAWTQTPVHSDDDELIGTKHELQISGVGPANLSLERVRELLNQPRATLKYKDQLFVKAPDAWGGPLPTSVVVNQVGNHLLVGFGVTAWTLEPKGTKQPEPEPKKINFREFL